MEGDDIMQTIRIYGNEKWLVDTDYDPPLKIRFIEYVNTNGGGGGDSSSGGGSSGNVYPINRTNNSSYGYLSGNYLNDTLTNYGSNSTVSGNGGHDIINNYADRTYIDGGSGNDSINLNDSDYVTVIGTGNSNDTITGSGTNRVYRYYDKYGEDVIVGYDDSDTIRLDGSQYFSTMISGSDILVSLANNFGGVLAIASGLIRLKDAAGKSLNIRGGTEDVAINSVNETAYAIIHGSSKNDTIVNHADGMKISVYGGNDLISNDGDDVTINAGAGADYISNSGSSVSLDAGEGNNSIENSGSNVSINAGWGDNSIKVNGGDDVTIGGSGIITGLGARNVITYYSGSDVVFGYTGDDSINLGNHSYTTLQSGNDKIINLHSGDALTFKSVGEMPLNVIGGRYGVNLSNSSSDTYVVLSGADGNDTIHNRASYATVIGGDGDDYIRNEGWH